jgi:hypothetical protein
MLALIAVDIDLLSGLVMVKVIRSIGYGLCAAGATLLVIYFLAVRLKGLDALYEAINPLAPRTYLVLSAIMPGAFCIWLANHLSWRWASAKLRGEGAHVVSQRQMAEDAGPSKRLPSASLTRAPTSGVVSMAGALDWN